MEECGVTSIEGEDVRVILDESRKEIGSLDHKENKSSVPPKLIVLRRTPSPPDVFSLTFH